MPMTPAFGYSFDINRMELASGTGSGRNTTECTIAKRAVFAAIQTEKVRKTVKANPFARHKVRAEYFRSNRNGSMICDSFFQRLHIRQPQTPGRGRLEFTTYRRQKSSDDAHTIHGSHNENNQSTCGGVRFFLGPPLSSGLNSHLAYYPAVSARLQIISKHAKLNR